MQNNILYAYLIYIYIKLSHIVINDKLTQHCKSTMLLKKENGLVYRCLPPRLIGKLRLYCIRTHVQWKVLSSLLNK